MQIKLYHKAISTILCATMLVGSVSPTISAYKQSVIESKSANNVGITAFTKQLLNINKHSEEHTQTLEITNVSFDIKRDFDQSCYVTVKNTGSESVEFLLSAENPYDDIFLGFVEAGSDSQPTLLEPNQTTKVELSVFAQKASKDSYTIPVKSYVVDGTNYILDDQKDVTLTLPKETLKFACSLTSVNENTLEQNYLITNNGNDLSCVDIYPEDSISDYVSLNPGVSESPIKAGESISICIKPNLSKIKEDNVTLIEGNIIISSAGKQQTFAVSIDTKGQEIYTISMANLINYQKGDKDFYDVDADLEKAKESINVVDNSHDEEIDYNYNISVPLIDKNTNTQIMNSEIKTNIKNYTGNEPAGTVLDFDVSYKNDEIVVKFSSVVGSEDLMDLKESMLFEMSDSYDVNGETVYESYGDVVESKSSNEKSFAENFSDYSDNYNQILSGTDTFVASSYVTLKEYKGSNTTLNGLKNAASRFSDTTAAKKLEELNSKLDPTKSNLGKAFTAASVVSTGVELYTGQNYRYADAVLDSPNIDSQRKQEYVNYGTALGAEKILSTGIGLGLALWVSGPVGWFAGAALFIGSYLIEDWLEDEMEEIEQEAGIDENGNPIGGAETDEYKRNQCTNAQKISSDTNWNYPSPTSPDDDEPSTQPPTQPPTQSPTQSPTQPPTQKPTQAPTQKPTQPPTQPTEPPTEAPTKRKTPTEKWNFYLKTDKETVKANEVLNMWVESNIDLTPFKFKYQYKKVGSWVWQDITKYTSSKTCSKLFEDEGRYLVRVVIKPKNASSDFWVAVDKVISVSGDLLESNKGLFHGQSGMFITTRLAAGDISQNDQNMQTTYYVNGVYANKTSNNSHSSVSMASLGAMMFSYNGRVKIDAVYSTTPVHYRAVSDMEVIKYYPRNSKVHYVGMISSCPNVLIKPDFAVYEENIYTDGDVYVGDQTILYCDVYNRNLGSGWADITVRDGKNVIYSASNVLFSGLSEHNIKIPWTPTTKESNISVSIVNKCTNTSEIKSSNNSAERILTAIDYQVPEINDISTTTALENREFSISANVNNTKNVTGAKMYVDGVEVNEVKSSKSNDTTKYWAYCNNLTAGKHKVKFVATYEKIGHLTATEEKEVEIDVVSLSESALLIKKNTSSTIKNISASVYKSDSFVKEYNAEENGDILVGFTEQMYKNPSEYTVVVNTTSGFYRYTLKAGEISVNNSKLQRTFTVEGIRSVRVANFYVKGSDTEYYKQIPYSVMYDKNGNSLIYFTSENYTKFKASDSAYMLVVTYTQKMHKLQIKENGKYLVSLNTTIKLNDSNIYDVVTSSKAMTVDSNEAQSSGNNIYTQWGIAYNNKAYVNVKKLGNEVISKEIANNEAIKLPNDVYDFSYAIKSENYSLDLEKQISINGTGYTNSIGTDFEGVCELSEYDVNIGDVLSADISDIKDTYGNVLKEISSLKGNDIVFEVVFTNVNDNSKVYKQEISTKSFSGKLEEITIPNEAGSYTVGISATLKTSSAITDIESITLSKSKLTLDEGTRYSLSNIKVNPESAISDYVWTSSNKNVATVNNNGNVTAVGIGTATITVTAANGVKASCTVEVKSANKFIMLTKSKIKINVGSRYSLSNGAIVKPEKDTLTWTSSNKNVATVNTNGNVTAVGVGKATITVKSSSGVTATCEVVVA